MKDKFFIDTNVLVYANDRMERAKHERAKQILLNGIADENIALSAQVLSEFYVTVTRKIQIKLPENIARKEILLLKAVDIVEIDFHLVLRAVDISTQNGLSFWDSLIVAAAEKSKCTVLYSEDLNHNQRIDSVTVINPFLL
jgi:predicted nucleic acid-binding protein